MAVSLPTAADVRKIRENTRKIATAQAELARTPLLAFLGASDFAVESVVKAATDARTRSTAQAGSVQERLAGLPQLTAEELRTVAEEFRALAGKPYGEFVARGEQALDRFREQPQVKQAIENVESYTAKLDARVDAFVDQAHDATEKALAAVSAQTRSTGEKVAHAAQRFTGQAATNISEATKDAAEAVKETGDATAAEAGDEVVKETRSVTRKAANRTAPKAARKPAATDDTTG